MFSRRAKLVLILAVGAIVLACVPASIAEKIKLSALTLLVPVKRAALQLVSVFERRPRDQEHAREVAFWKRKFAQARQRGDLLESQLGSRQSLAQIDYEQRFEPIFADVIVPGDSSPWRGSLVVAKGSTHGVTPGLVVVYQQYLVGRIHQTSPLSSRVLLVSDPSFRIEALLQMPGETFQRGVARGREDGKIVLQWAGNGNVETGLVVTTAVDSEGRTPKGLQIGRVFSLDRIRGAYPEIVVEPSLVSRSLPYAMILSPKPALPAGRVADRRKGE